MTTVQGFTFSPFQENTYVLYDETKECIIIDPGCYEQHEKEKLADFITQHELKPVRLINTHSHIDHIFGNKFVADTYQLTPEMHEKEVPGMRMVPSYGASFGLKVEPSPEPTLLPETGTVTFGNSTLEILFTPGHSIASLSFYSKADGFVIAGDTLFKQSIGRTDLPGGDYDTLIKSIATQLLPLGDEVVVYSGHMEPTTIGAEKQFNPFLKNVILS